MTKEGKSRVKVGISVGDINGIGLEVILKTFRDNRMYDLCTPVIYCSSKVAMFHKKQLGINEVGLNMIKNADKLQTKKINVVTCWEEESLVEFGTNNSTGGAYSFKSLEAATKDIASNKLDVLVTAPINKQNIQSDQFKFPGHTEYLADYANEDFPLMIMCHERLKVALLTGHVPIKEVAESMSQDLILKKLEVFQRSLIQDFGVRKPKIAVLGLNPHAGDEGLIGKEEQEIIIPALKKARENGILAFGPFPADGFFGSGNYARYDGTLAMFHDQGLSPFKAMSFDEGVNYTAGLPIVRTSPDHGTAMEIAGKNQASETSFRNAVYLACDIFRHRKEYKQLISNPLPTGKKSLG